MTDLTPRKSEPVDIAGLASARDVRQAFRRWISAYSPGSAIYNVGAKVYVGLRCCEVNPGVRSLELALAADVAALKAALAGSNSEEPRR